MGAHHCHVATVVARRLGLFVAVVVLFVDDDQAQILNRRKHARSRRDNHARLASADASPLLGTLGIVECGMQNRHPIAEARKELSGNGGRQRNLRH